MPGSSNGLFPSGVPTKTIYTSALPHKYYVPRPSYSFRFDYSNNNWSVHILKNSWIHFKIHHPPSSAGINGCVTKFPVHAFGAWAGTVLVLHLPSPLLPLVLGIWKALRTVISTSMPDIRSWIARHVVLIHLMCEGSWIPSHFIYAVTSFIKIDYPIRIPESKNVLVSQFGLLALSSCIIQTVSLMLTAIFCLHYR
jgi:hypothetical protein